MIRTSCARRRGGCVAVLAIPVFGLGLVALLGYGLRTARATLRGDANPLPEWDDLTGILTDGLRAAAVVLGYGAIGALVAGAFLVFSFIWAAIGEAVGSPLGVIVSLIGLLGGLVFVALLILLLQGLLPIGILKLAAGGTIGPAFAFNDSVALIRANLGNFLFLLLSLLLFNILSQASVVLCIVGAIPGMFWGFAAWGAAIGHAGRLMGVRAS